MKVSFDNEEILSAIDRVAKKTMTMDLTWDWPCGVAYYGLAEAYKATGKTEYMEFLKNWVDEYIEMGLPSWNVNTCAMGHCLITLYEYTGDKKYWDLVMSKIDYLRNDALRFGDHVLQHTVSSNNDFPEQCWADTLFKRFGTCRIFRYRYVQNPPCSGRSIIIDDHIAGSKRQMLCRDLHGSGAAGNNDRL